MPSSAPPSRSCSKAKRPEGPIVSVSSVMGHAGARGYLAYGDRQGRPGPVHPAGRPGSRPAHPGQRGGGRLHGHLGPGHRPHQRRAAHGDGGVDPAPADRRSPGRSRRPSCSWLRRPAPTSRGGSSKWTAACRRPTSTSGCPTSESSGLSPLWRRRRLPSRAAEEAPDQKKMDVDACSACRSAAGIGFTVPAGGAVTVAGAP